MGEAFIYESEKAIVKIYPGKRTEEERRQVLGEAMKQYYKAIQGQITERK